MEDIECCGRCRKCKNHCEDYGSETLWHDIRNLLWTIPISIRNNIIDPLSVWKARRSKRIYECRICGELFAPKYEDCPELSLITYRWAKIHLPLSCHKHDKYICHHCFDHGFRRTDEPLYYGSTWDEWQDVVDKRNKKLLTAIKEKDPEYYDSYVKNEYDWLIEKYGLE